MTGNATLRSGFLTFAEALHQGTELLERADVAVPRLTAEVLLAHAARKERAWLYAHGAEPLSELVWIHFGRYLKERMGGKPTQYITGRQEFYGRDFYVDRRVLIPRPETEHLVDAALAYLREHSTARVVDVGTGSGAIAISIALDIPAASIIAVDISADAIKVAKRNRDARAARVDLVIGDLLDAVAEESADLVVSNPPYVPGADRSNMQLEVRAWEPHVALFASDDGLEIYRRLVPSAHRTLRPGGRLMMELGYQSLTAVRELLHEGWRALEVHGDLAGWPRVITAIRE